MFELLKGHLLRLLLAVSGHPQGAADQLAQPGSVHLVEVVGFRKGDHGITSRLCFPPSAPPPPGVYTSAAGARSRTAVTAGRRSRRQGP